MPNSTPAKRGQIVQPASPSLVPLEAAQVFTQVVTAYCNMKQVGDQEATKRREIEADERLELGRIHAQQAVLLDYLDKSFAERDVNFRELFRQVDAAQERGDSAAFGQLLEGIVDLAKTTPFGDLLDLKKVEALLADKQHHHRI